MWSDKKTIEKLIPAYFASNKMLVFKVTNRCNIECEHCREESGLNFNEVISVDIINKAFDKIDDTWIITLQGGEPSLFLERSKTICDIAKQRNIPHVFYTNGWWANDEEICRYIFDEIHPTYMVVSINKWTNQKIPIENANIIADKIKDRDTILIYSECHDFGPTMKNLLTNTSQVMDYEIARVGRAKDILSGISNICFQSGFTLEVNGGVYSNCCMGTKGCYYGDILTIDWSKHQKRYKKCLKN
jgi:organic radical activating enzyme